MWQEVCVGRGRRSGSGGREIDQMQNRSPRRLMRGNPENRCPVSLVSIFSKIIGQMCSEKICKHSGDNGIVSDKERWRFMQNKSSWTT